MPLANRDLFNRCDFGPGRLRSAQYLSPILHLRGLDDLPIPMQLLRPVPKIRIPTKTADAGSKPFDTERVIGQPILLLQDLFFAPSTSDSENLHVPINSFGKARGGNGLTVSDPLFFLCWHNPPAQRRPNAVRCSRLFGEGFISLCRFELQTLWPLHWDTLA